MPRRHYRPRQPFAAAFAIRRGARDMLRAAERGAQQWRYAVRA